MAQRWQRGYKDRECLLSNVKGNFTLKNLYLYAALIKLAIPGERNERKGVGNLNYEMDFYFAGYLAIVAV